MTRSTFLASIFGAPVVVKGLDTVPKRSADKPMLISFEVPCGVRYSAEKVAEMRKQIQEHLGPDVRFVIVQDGMQARVLG